jgi:hypothetical protein
MSLREVTNDHFICLGIYRTSELKTKQHKKINRREELLATPEPKANLLYLVVKRIEGIIKSTWTKQSWKKRRRILAGSTGSTTEAVLTAVVMMDSAPGQELA